MHPYSCSMGLRIVVPVQDQFVKQYSMCDKIIHWRYDLAALTVKKGLICLKFWRLNLIVFETFFTCFLNVRVESNMTPRYLNSGTSSSSTSPRNTFDDSSLDAVVMTYFTLAENRRSTSSQRACRICNFQHETNNKMTCFYLYWISCPLVLP